MLRAIYPEHLSKQARNDNEQDRGNGRFTNGHFPQATQLFDDLVASDTLAEFLTLKAYELLE